MIQVLKEDVRQYCTIGSTSKRAQTSVHTLMPALWMACRPGRTSECAWTSSKPLMTSAAASSELSEWPAFAKSCLTLLLAMSLKVAKPPDVEIAMPSRRVVANQSCVDSTANAEYSL